MGLQVIDFKGYKFAKFQIAACNPKHKFTIMVYAKLTTTLPKLPYENPINEDPTVNFTNDSLADPEPRNHLPIEVELGADLFHLIHRNGTLGTDVKNVIAEWTALGYTFTGPVSQLW